MTQGSAFRDAIAIASLVVCLPVVAAAQLPASKSSAVAKELTQTLDAKKLNAIAAKHPQDPERFVAALYFPGTQLLVVSGKYNLPTQMEARLSQKEYRDAYQDLSSVAPKDSKVFIIDMGAPGLATQKKGANTPFDTWTQGDKQVAFDGDWGKQKMSEADYMKSYTADDEEYATILGALLAEAKK